jgi:hypothetical protein
VKDSQDCVAEVFSAGFSNSPQTGGNLGVAAICPRGSRTLGRSSSCSYPFFLPVLPMEAPLTFGKIRKDYLTALPMSPRRGASLAVSRSCSELLGNSWRRLQGGSKLSGCGSVEPKGRGRVASSLGFSPLSLQRRSSSGGRHRGNHVRGVRAARLRGGVLLRTAGRGCAPARAAPDRPPPRS